MVSAYDRRSRQARTDTFVIVASCVWHAKIVMLAVSRA